MIKIVRRLIGWELCAIALNLFLASCDEKPKSIYLEGSPPHYVNPQFGVDVAIPEDLDVCVIENASYRSYGFAIPLTKDPDCKQANPYDLPNIRVYFDLGALYDEPPTIDDIVARECDEELKLIDMPDLIIPDHTTAVCRGPDLSYGKDENKLTPNGLIETALFTWAGGEQGTFFNISLSTTESRLAQDMATLKRVLPGIKLTEHKDE
jgi:hypothetical protein